MDWTITIPTNAAGEGTGTASFHLDPNADIGTYSIDAHHGPTFAASNMVIFKVKPGGVAFDFTILLSPTSITVEPGAVGNFKLLLTYSDPSHQGTMINIQVTGLGSGMNFQLSTLGDLTITTSSTTPPGTYPFTVIGSAQGKTHQTSGIIIVTAKAPPFDYSITITPTTSNN